MGQQLVGGARRISARECHRERAAIDEGDPPGRDKEVGQALRERTVYDEHGQFLTGSYMDYAMPRAEDAPKFTSGFHPVPATTNPLGAKGCGEAGCAGSLPAVMNAVVDALSVYGIHHIDMPATPLRVWRAIQAAKATR